MDEELDVNETAVEETAVNETPAVKDCKDLKLNYPQTLKVGLGFAVVMIFWTVYNFVVPLLLEQAFGFSNTIRNVIVGIASAMCMVLLPIFGGISDRSGKSKLGRKFGRRTPFIVIGTVITIIAMILVPISVAKQLTKSNEIRTQYQAFFQSEDANIEIVNPETGDKITRKALLESWYEEAENGNYKHIKEADFKKLKGEYTKEQYAALYNPNISNGKVMGVIGSAAYTIRDVEYNAETGLFSVKSKEQARELDEETYNGLNKVATAYAQYVDDAANDFVSAAVNNKVNWGFFVFFLIALILIILAQTVIRTPAVSLMPDVTPSPLRSPGNAMINLIGGVGGGIGFLIYTITFMFADKIPLSTQYWIIFGTMAASLALVLTLFILLVRERQMVEQCNKICREYGLPVYEEAEDQPKEEKKPKTNMFKTYGKKKMTSFLLILGSIFMWFIGYYAIANNMPIYCVKILGVSTGLASIVSGASLVVAAIGFIPVGIMGRKIGRRWSIIFGFSLAVISYVLVAACVKKASDTATIIFMACYMVSGFGLIFANVNTLPMVLEVSSPEDIGRFTGIYYIATMSAQTVGPILGGLVMDYIGGSWALFVFSAACVALGAVMMLFVKHGEAPDFLAAQAARKAANS
jgi:MFS family permease